MKISIKPVYQYMVIFFNFLPISNHLHPLQVENCDSNSRLVVDEDDNVKSGLKGLKDTTLVGAIWGIFESIPSEIESIILTTLTSMLCGYVHKLLLGFTFLTIVSCAMSRDQINDSKWLSCKSVHPCLKSDLFS